MENNEVIKELNKMADECIAKITSDGQQKLRDIFIAGYANGATNVNFLQCQDCPKDFIHPRNKLGGVLFVNEK